MDREAFKKQIEQEIKKLNRDQKIYFAWLCAVKALPFLGSYCNFNYWEINERQKYLEAIFYSLDANAARTIYSSDVLQVIATNAATNASIAARAAAKADKAYSYSKTTTIARAANLANAVSFAAANASFAASSISMNSNSNERVNKASVAAAIAFNFAAEKNNIDFKSNILNDLKAIRVSSQRRKVDYSIMYGVIWNNFQIALQNEKCEYWRRLYQTIFDKGFVFDDEDKVALQRRMSVPPEIREQGAAAVGDYLELLEQGAERFNESRIIILGDKGAGKTCLARRLVNLDAPMTTDEESTPGVDTSVWKLEKENINVHIWDFAGHTVTHAVHQFFLSERCLYVIVCNGRNEEEKHLEYWLNHMKNFGGDSKAIILVNTRDQHRVEIPVNILKEQYPIIDVCTFSIRDNKTELADFRKEVANYIQNNPSWSNQLIPAKYYKVKNDLEELFVNGKKEGRKERITREEFEAIARKYGEENFEELLTHLHALGISLWYKEMEHFNTLVLNPEWISDGVYKIINWANEAKKHCLTISDFAEVFKEEKNRYPESQFRFLFELMMKYELAYETKEKNVLIIPHLLQEDRPEKLPDFPVGESLMARYKADQPLPPNTISRFIVRHNEQIKKEGKAYLVWRSGVILDDAKGNTALVREEDRTITVSVKGPGKTKFISALRETLNNIFNSYKNKKPELQYRVERFGEIPLEVAVRSPLWLPDRQILTYALDNVPYYDDSTRQQISLNPTVNNYNITIQTLINGQGNQYLDQSIHNTFNFHNCNISLQENLNDLARRLTKAGSTEEAKEIKDAVELLEEAESCKTPEEVKKKGIARSLQHLAQKLGDEDSKLHKTVEGIKEGIGIAQDIAKGYNDVAQWLGLPQVPKPFLKKE